MEVSEQFPLHDHREREAVESLYVRHSEAETVYNKGLVDVYDREGLPQRERQRIEIWILKGSELATAPAEKLLSRLHETKVAGYFGGIGMGISGNDTEYKDDEGKGKARVPVGNEWDMNATILQKMGKIERGMPADFLANPDIGMEMVFTVMPQENQKGLKSSLRSDMLTKKYMAEELKTREVIWEEWDWSNSGFKKATIDRAAKAMLDWGNRMALKAGKMDTHATLDEAHEAFEWLERTAPTWQKENGGIFKTPLEALQYMRAYEDVDVYMGGVPDGRESLTFPITGASETLFAQALTETVLKAQRWGVGKLGKWENESPFIKAVLEGKPMPESWRRRIDNLTKRMGLDVTEGKLALIYKNLNEGIAGDQSLLLSRLAEMGRVDAWIMSDLVFPGEEGEVTEKLWQESRKEAVTTVVVDYRGKVVDSSRGVASKAHWLWGENNSMVLVADPEVPYINESGQIVYSDLGHGAVKEIAAELRSWNALKKLKNKGVPLWSVKVAQPGETQLESHLRPAARPLLPNEAIVDEYKGLLGYRLFHVDQEMVEGLREWVEENKGEEHETLTLVEQALKVFDTERAKFSTIGEDLYEGLSGEAMIDVFVFLGNLLRAEMAAEANKPEPVGGVYSAQVVRAS